jgi:hypothetical protein
MSVLNQLLSMRSQLDTMIAAASGSADLKIKTKGKKASAEKAEKKPRANAGQGTAWSAFSSKIQKDHAEELNAVKADAAERRAAAKEAGEEAPADCVGAHLHWCSRYKAEHEAEWLAFKADWESAHPKSSRATSEAGSVAGDVVSAGEEAPKKKRGPKKDSELSPDELAAKKAARAAKKVAKAAEKAVDEGAARAASVMAAPAVKEAPEAEEDAATPENGLCPFRYKKVSYLRFGHKDADGDDVWHEDGDLWLALADGSKGAYAGVLKADGSIDTSADVMAAGELIEID